MKHKRDQGSENEDHDISKDEDKETTGTGPIIVNEESTIKGIRSEYDYIEKEVGEKRDQWIRKTQMVMHGPNGKTIDLITVVTSDGREHYFSFDVSKFFGKV